MNLVNGNNIQNRSLADKSFMWTITSSRTFKYDRLIICRGWNPKTVSPPKTLYLT